MLFERQQGSDKHAARVGDPLGAGTSRLQLLQASLGDGLTLARLGIDAGVVVNFVGAVIMLGGVLELRVLVCGGGLEVEIAQGMAARLDAAVDMPPLDKVDAQAAMLIGREVGQLRATRRRLVRGQRIAEHERVLTGGVHEVKVDTLILQQPTHEVEVGFSVLDHIRPRLVHHGKAQLDVGEAVLSKHGEHDVGHGLLLEDPAVAHEPQEREPGLHDDAIQGVLADAAQEAKLRDDPREDARVFLLDLEDDAQRLPEVGLRFEVWFVAEDVDGVAVGRTDALEKFHRAKDEISNSRPLQRNWPDTLFHAAPSSAPSGRRRMPR